nr:hypothetical protein [Tanacetum cinerariifolium]
MRGEGITYSLKGLGVTREHLGANGGKKRYLATVVQVWAGDKRFGGFGRVSPWGWEGLTLKLPSFGAKTSLPITCHFPPFYPLDKPLPPPPLTPKPKKEPIPAVPRNFNGYDHDPKSHSMESRAKMMSSSLYTQKKHI